MTRFNILSRQERHEEAYKALEEYNKEYSSPQVLSMLGDYEMGMYNDSSALAYTTKPCRWTRATPRHCLEKLKLTG